MDICKYRFDCANYMVYDCCGYDCYIEGTHEDYRLDHDFDDPDFIG